MLREEHMNNRISRREFGRLTAATASIAVFGGLTGPAAAETRLRLIWWGNPDRDKRTNDVVDLYQQKNPEVSIAPENYQWGDYWQKLATQAAGRNLPDVIQMDYRYIFEYARRGQLAELDSFIGNQIDLADFDQNQLNSGKVDGKVYGISMGANSMATVYNKTKLDELGVEMPDPTKWNYDDLATIGKDVKDKLPDGLYFIANRGWTEPWLETWVRQRGKALYTEDGKLGYDLDDLTDFWAFWYQMQQDGLTPPPDVQALDQNSIETGMIVTGHSVLDFCHSNQLVAVQKLMKDKAALTMLPNQVDGKPGQYMKPSMLISMAASSAQQEDAAKLINFLITDPEAGDILQIERGVTGDASIRERLTKSLGEVETAVVNYLDTVATSVGPLPPPPPKNAGELDRAIRPAWEAVAFGKVGVEDGAKDFYAKAEATLARS
jgi:multiple sugar transport system substrate-binding protein